MNPETYIEAAIEKGQKLGLVGLAGPERKIFLISEAEVYCDMEGIDSFLNRYEKEEVEECSEAFVAIGATEIAEAMKNVTNSWPSSNNELLNKLNSFITGRVGYNYASILKYVENNI